MSESPKLASTLQRRHLSMIAIAGVIGAGLFVGSGAAIKQAGPGALIAYAVCGLLVILVMRMLGEMSAANPETGSFSAYADRAIGPWAGFTIGWLYWFFWVVVLGVEATAGASIVHRWIPAVPQWTWALVLMALLTVTNLFSVRSYGEFEFWFASIKVAAIAVFVWLVIAVSQLRMRRQLERDHPERLTLRMWGYPYLTWASIAAMIVRLAGMAFDADARSQLLLSLLVAALVLVVGVIRHRVRVRNSVSSVSS